MGQIVGCEGYDRAKPTSVHTYIHVLKRINCIQDILCVYNVQMRKIAYNRRE